MITKFQQSTYLLALSLKTGSPAEEFIQTIYQNKQNMHSCELNYSKAFYLAFILSPKRNRPCGAGLLKSKSIKIGTPGLSLTGGLRKLTRETKPFCTSGLKTQFIYITTIWLKKVYFNKIRVIFKSCRASHEALFFDRLELFLRPRAILELQILAALPISLVLYYTQSEILCVSK